MTLPQQYAVRNIICRHQPDGHQGWTVTGAGRSPARRPAAASRLLPPAASRSLLLPPPPAACSHHLLRRLLPPPPPASIMEFSHGTPSDTPKNSMIARVGAGGEGGEPVLAVDSSG